MKIGYIRQNQPVELDFWNASASNLGTELRNGILEAFLQLGHEVTIYSPISKKHLHVLNGEGEGFDYELFKNLKYDPDGLPSDLDLLFIEAASTASIYTYNATDKKAKPYMERTFEVVGAHTGRTVVYQHGNYLLGFPFGEVGKPTDGLADNNIKVIIQKANVFTNGKTWEIWHHATDNEAFLTQMGRVQRLSYDKAVKEMGVVSRYIPMAYSQNFDILSPPPKNPKYDLIYVGSSRDANRQKKLAAFYANLDWYDLKVKVIGDWSEVCGFATPWNKHNFVPQEHMGIEFAGRIGGHGEVYSFYDEALATVQITDSQFEKEGMITTRVIQAIRSGVVLFSDRAIPGMADYVGEDMLFDSWKNEEFVQRLLEIKRMPYEERCALVESQRARLKRWVDVLPEALG